MVVCATGLTPRARWRRLWWRSAPALVALTTVFVAIRIITLASGGGDHTVRLWKPAAPDRERATLRGHLTTVSSLAFAPHADWLATASNHE